jgi:hypothetical protein
VKFKKLIEYIALSHFPHLSKEQVRAGHFFITTSAAPQQLLRKARVHEMF